ncbi:hypothetical protein [Brevibacillus laterosporus]|uniref:hypothetical protein n=1 Tax=Brevibacillus laterosporus TaxID=1465 RepID=UPI003D1B24DD
MPEKILYKSPGEGSTYIGAMTFMIHVLKPVTLLGFVCSSEHYYYNGTSYGTLGEIGYRIGGIDTANNVNKGFKVIKIRREPLMEFPEMSSSKNNYSKGFKFYLEEPIYLSTGNHSFYFQDYGGAASYNFKQLSFADEYIDATFPMKGSGNTEQNPINNGAIIKGYGSGDGDRYARIGFIYDTQQPVAKNVTGHTPWFNAIRIGMTPRLTFEYSSPDGNPLASYQIKIVAFSNVDNSHVTVVDKEVTSTNPWYDVQKGELEVDKIYYWQVIPKDSKGIKAVSWSTATYFGTNLTPYRPYLIHPRENIRTGVNPVFETLPSSDLEKDKQYLRLQLATDPDFKYNLKEFNSSVKRSGWEAFNGKEWVPFPEEGILKDEYNKVRYTCQNSLTEGWRYYWRMSGIDASTGGLGEWSDTQSIRVGDKLFFQLKNPIKTSDYVKRGVIHVIRTLPTQSRSVKRLEESDQSVVFKGNWNTSSYGKHSGGISRFSKTKGDFAEVSFTSTGIRFLGYVSSGLGKADIYVDDQYNKTVSFDLPDETQKVLFEILGLSYGDHKIKIVVAEEGKLVYVDAFEIIIDEYPATFKVEACNNAFDDTPVWEDVTNRVIEGKHHDFSNRTKSAVDWGLNVRITVEAEGSYSPIEIGSFGINYD